jgi:hypothetical protein
MVPRSQLIYRYLQMAISMTVDLHLDNDPSIVVDQWNSSASKALPQLRRDNPLDRAREAFRAALGCFYLSSVYVSASL